VISAVIAAFPAARFPGTSCRSRQPEKILLPPELSNLLAEPVELSLFPTGEQAQVTGTGLAHIDAGLPTQRARLLEGRPCRLATALQESPSCRQSPTAYAFCCGVPPHDLSSKPGNPVVHVGGSHSHRMDQARVLPIPACTVIPNTTGCPSWSGTSLDPAFQPWSWSSWAPRSRWPPRWCPAASSRPEQPGAL